MANEGHDAARKSDPNDWISQDNSAVPEKRPGAPEFSGPRAFGRLVLLKALARGGMGEVYLAALGDIEGAERPCVVKLIRHEHRDDASFLARFLDEARIQAQMQHPGVAQVLEAAIDPDGRPYVVVEYVAGRDLAEIRQRANQLKLAIGWSDAVAIAASISEALAHVHEQTDPEGRPLEVVHRDLSPQNIMVSYVGDTKLIDFGTARGENRRCQTVNGIVFAKPGYVAPEVAANNPGGAPADLYALGIVLWELIAGRRFLQGDTQEHLAAVAKGERTPPALALWLAVPRELDTIIGRLTATRIEDRFGSAREATEHLVKLLQQAPGLANGERSVRSRVAHLMLRLYPAEPARSRAEFAQLIAVVRKSGGIRPDWSGSPRPAVVEARDTLFPGTRYRVLREIASGPMGVVLEAQHVDLGRKVALKVLDRQRCPSAEAEARFRHEARVVAQLRHDNLVQVHDFGIASDGRPYYAMEYLEGETLAQLQVRRGRLPWSEVVELGVQACQALEAAHALGIVHRDIKPQNLFLTTGGTLKLLDFGITQTDAEPERANTESLSLIGTPEYMAPEQIGRAAVDARADVYGLGAVLYELLTGCLPHTGENTVALLDNKMHDRVKAPSQRVRKLRLPRYLDRVILTALATETKDRYDNIVGLRQDLVWILSQQSKQPGETRRWVFGSMAALAAAAALALVTVDSLRERIQVTALPLRASATQAWRAAAKALPSAPGPDAESQRPVSATIFPPSDELARAAEPAQDEPIAAAQLAHFASNDDGAAEDRAADDTDDSSRNDSSSGDSADDSSADDSSADDSEVPENSTEAEEGRALAARSAEAAPGQWAPPARTAPAVVGAVTSRIALAPRNDSKPALAGQPSGDIRQAVAAVLAAETQAKLAAKHVASAAKPPPASQHPADRKQATAARATSAKELAAAKAAKPQLAAKPVVAVSKPAAASRPILAASDSKPARAAKLDPELEQALSEAEALMGKRDLDALEAFRHLGRSYPREARVLAGWSQIAATTRWWGESLKVAERWATLDASAPAQLNLARTQKRMGQVERAIATLKTLLVKHPSDREATSLLQMYGGTPVALR
jgi:serine/threonine protein kinase